jgi:hypothetical protein
LVLRVDLQSGSDCLLKPLEPSSIENLTQVKNNIIQSLFVRSDFPPELQESEDGDDGVELEFRTTDELQCADAGFQFRSVREKISGDCREKSMTIACMSGMNPLSCWLAGILCRSDVGSSHGLSPW